MDKKLAWFESKNVDVLINDKKIIKGLTTNFFLGENIVILGQNGSGKSTLVNLINRNIYPIHQNNSYLKLFGKKSINIWDLRREIGFVSNDINERLNKKNIVSEVIFSGLKGSMYIDRKIVPSLSESQFITKILNKLDISNLSNKRYGELSDGQKRVVIIARAIVHNPKVIILDEPTDKLDNKSKFLLLALLDKLANNKTIVQVTHSIDNVLKSTNRIIIMKEGQIIRDGETNKILTSKNITQAYDTKLDVKQYNGYWQIYPSI